MPDSCALFPSHTHNLPGGGSMRYAVFEPEGSPRGTVLVLPGRREFIEKKHSELGREFLTRNFRLIIVEWRGQGLSARFLSSAARQRDHIENFQTYLDDLHSFYGAVVRSGLQGPLVVVGHSMGSHLALRAANEGLLPEATAVIVTAPMLALASRRVHAFARVLCFIAVKLGRSKNYAPGQHDYGVQETTFDNNPLTQNPQRFKIMEDYFTAHPNMTVGGVTWGWLRSALASMHLVQKPSYLERITIPVLALTGGKDRVTPARELSRYLDSMPQADHIILLEARHDLMNELEPIRAEAWKHIDGFLEWAMPA
ncbi:MAG: alpha/beta hydrolase [Alphaproteobacteria bacterium]|nr:alpha/beta hydrolase [Alphaproteobacteria bacterium]